MNYGLIARICGKGLPGAEGGCDYYVHSTKPHIASVYYLAYCEESTNEENAYMEVTVDVTITQQGKAEVSELMKRSLPSSAVPFHWVEQFRHAICRVNEDWRSVPDEHLEFQVYRKKTGEIWVNFFYEGKQAAVHLFEPTTPRSE